MPAPCGFVSDHSEQLGAVRGDATHEPRVHAGLPGGMTSATHRREVRVGSSVGGETSTNHDLPSCEIPMHSEGSAIPFGDPGPSAERVLWCAATRGAMPGLKRPTSGVVPRDGPERGEFTDRGQAEESAMTCSSPWTNYRKISRKPTPFRGGIKAPSLC